MLPLLTDHALRRRLAAKEPPLREFLRCLGLPLKPEGELPVFDTYLGGQKIAPLANLSEDVSLAARNATLNMIDFLVKTKGLSREQAYVLVSVAVDLHIAQLVDVRTWVSQRS